MSDPEERVWVVFNGEIFNFPELRQELEGRGHTFRTHSDTEVILHGYREWGVDVLEHLNGMFGLAIWDVDQQRLMLARDRMGIKFVYYRLDERGIQFGSEMRAVLASGGERPGIDPGAINLFLRYRYTPSPLTVLEGIRKLPPGGRLIIEKGAVRTERWYQFSPEPFDPMPDPETAAEQLLEIYRRAIKRHLLSDVPLGLLLSGGLDSGLLLGLMMEQGSDWQTYTVGFGGGYRDDELAGAADTARLFGVPNHQVQLDEATFRESLHHIIDTVEEPIASPSIVPMFHVSQRARQDVKVVIAGQGPDELFGGYSRHLGIYLGPAWRALPRAVRSPLQSLLGCLPRNRLIKRAIHSLDVPDRMQRYQSVFSVLPGSRINALFQDASCGAHADEQYRACLSDLEPLMANTDELGGFQFLEVRSTLPDELLLYGDKLSMTHGLELRVPFLDVEAVEYAERLDASLKVRYCRGKRLHREVCKKFLPDPILRRRKIGFDAPIDEWFRNSVDGRLKDRLLDPQSRIYEFLQQQPIDQLRQEHERGRSDHHNILFSLVLLEDWLRGSHANGGIS